MGKNLKAIVTESLFFRLYVVFILAWSALMIVHGNEGLMLLINENHNDVMDPVFKYVTLLGGTNITVAIGLLHFVPRLRWGVMAVIGIGGSAAITQVLKRWVFDWPRPSVVYQDQLNQLNLVDGVELASRFSFPSGHATATFAVCFLLSLILFKRKYLGLLLCLLAISVAFSRAYLFQHFPEDILVGSLIGGTSSMIAYSWLRDRKLGTWGDKSLVGKAP